MYSNKSTNQQQDGRQAPIFKAAPKGGHFVLHIGDVVTDKGEPGLAVWGEGLQEADHETPARRIAILLKSVVECSPDTIGEVMEDVIKRNQKGQQ
jgi:hypothetical protein